MSGSRIATVAVLLAAAWFGRGLVAPDGDVDEEPFGPIARFAEPEAVDLDWEANPEVRDPFLPLVLPSTPPDGVSDAG